MRAAVVVLLVESAVLIILPTTRLPRPARVLSAGVNLVALAVLWLATRQRFSGK